MFDNRNPRCDLLAVVLIIATLFLSVSLLTYQPADPVGKMFPPLDRFYQADVLVWPQNPEIKNACGHWGAVVSDLLFTTLGIGAFFLVIGMGAVALALLQHQQLSALWSKSFGWLLSLVGMTTLAAMLLPSATLGPIIGPGGYIGALGNGLLKMHFAGTGGLLVAISVLATGLFLWTEYVFLKLIGFGLLGLASVFSFLLPTGSLGRIREWLQTEREDDDEDYYDEEEDEVDAGTTVRRRSIYADDPDDEEESEDDAAAEYEDDEEEDEAWYEEELDDEPGTIPFVIKTAAKNAAVLEEDATEEEIEEEPEAEETPPSKRAGLFGLRNKKRNKVEEERQEVITRLNEASRKEETEDYDLPTLDLLKKSKQVPQDELLRQTSRRGRLLEKKFEEFGQKVRVVDVETGPVITQYELDLDTGLRLSKVMGLADDLAIGLRVPSVRIVAPIPGKNTVGIEVPNEQRQVVCLRDVMELSTPKTKKMKIPLFLGQDVSGNEIVSDLSKLPHLLIAGRTGTGKSVCLNAIIASILMTRRPDEVRMLMIDPKMVELSGYSRLPHLMHPVVTDMRKAEAILAWAVEKMEERYRLMARAGVRHINSFNQLGEEELLERLQPEDDERDEIPVNMPFIVIIADEMADLMMTAGKEVEQHIIRLAQKSRAVGIHLILATQKPTVDVLTGLIKSNLPARISFQVASQTDSRVVLDANGAEKLLGNGDMLFVAPGTSTLLRGQGTFLTDDEIDSITEAVSTGEQNFVNELVNIRIKQEGDGDDFGEKLRNRDELYQRAVETVIQEDRGSVSLLQRMLKIGYGRAARLIDFMEEDGIVGPYNGSKSREIIMTMDQWHQFQAGEDSQASSSSVPETATPPSKRVQLATPDLDDEEDEDELNGIPVASVIPAAEPDIADDVEEAEEDDEDWEYGSEDDSAHDENDHENDHEDEDEDEDDEPSACADEVDDEWEYEEVDEEGADEDDEYDYVYEDDD